MSAPMFEGYGQTESAAGSTVTLPGDTTLGHVGAPLACNEIKLVDVRVCAVRARARARTCVCAFLASTSTLAHLTFHAAGTRDELHCRRQAESARRSVLP
jgi:long-subunit acyl-CoA synthetase (AMP-forming)